MEIELYTPHAKQAEIHRAINKGREKYYTLCIGRQFGKSVLAENQAVDWMVNKKWHGAWVSPTYRQAKKVADEMDSMFEGLFNYNRTEMVMRVPSGGSIQFFSSERYDNIRGFTFDFLIVDEAAFQAEEAWTEVLRATVLVHGKKVLFVSTPKGKNWFHNMFQLDGVNPAYRSFKFTSYDNPMIDPKEIDGAKETLPEHVFRQEYLAEFLDGNGSLFGRMKFYTPTDKTKTFFGVDVGRANDYTVLTILNENGEMVFCDRWRHDSWELIKKRVADKINEYGAIGLVEVNSIGDPFLEDLRKLVKQADPFQTTNKTKQDIIEGLIVACENGETSCLDIDWLRKELEVFEWEYLPKTRSVRYSAPSGFHDDGVMSYAIAYHAMKNLKMKGVYYVR